MSTFTEIVTYPIPFVIVLTILVFVHEFGHFWVARKCGVKIDTFSIGFGKELFGWNDKHGTRWKFSILPLGGYVKMFGDEDGTSWTEETSPQFLEKIKLEVKRRLALQDARFDSTNHLFSTHDNNVQSTSNKLDDRKNINDDLSNINIPTIINFEPTEVLIQPSNIVEYDNDIRVKTVTNEILKQVFANKPVWARAAIIAAGPIANFIFTIVVFALLFAAVGERFTTPDVQELIPGGAAEEAGIKPGDLFVSINGTPIQRFEQITEIVQTHPGDVLSIRVRNDGVERDISVTPRVTTEKDNFGRPYHDVRIGIKHTGGSTIVRLTPAQAVVESFSETGHLISGTLRGVWQMIEGTRPADQMGGVIAIGQMSHDTAESGVLDLIYFMALLSVNLGLLNLFPIPILDGGHLLFCAVEAVKGRQPSENVMKYSFRFGMALILTLAIFANWNDLVHLGLLDFVRAHLS